MINSRPEEADGRRFGDWEMHLLIGKNATAEQQLRNISYFRIAGYLRYMEEDHERHLYKPDSSFGQAINLYLFDKELGQLIFKAIQDIEISLRIKMIQTFSMEHGAFWFMDSSLFKDTGFYKGCLETTITEPASSPLAYSNPDAYQAVPPVVYLIYLEQTITPCKDLKNSLPNYS